ncbi:MAG TPA: HlyD family efflux transporter periplasmic adaptor subunit [Rubrivivax sp.]|nr:HlyD family efflux transporter periplasmic adaptor subunit [Rubrivivax sp.]
MDQPLSPQALRRRRTRALLLGALAMAVLAGAAWGLNRQIRPSVALSEVLVAEVQRGAIDHTVNATGLVIPSKEEQVTSPVATRVARVHAKAGQTVAAGERLLTLDNQQVQLAIEALREQIGQQDHKLAVLQLDLEQKLKQITSSIELLELDLKSAQARWGRYQEFKDSGTISKNELLTAELAVQRAEIQLRQQREQIDDARRSTRSLADANRLQKSILHKQLDQQAALLAQTEVRAPFAGVLTWLLADEGASVTAGQLVARVSGLQHFGVEASLSDLHARALAPGQAARVEHAGQVLAGVVQTVLPEIQNGSVKLLLKLQQPDHPLLRHKLRVDVAIVTEQRADTLVATLGPAFNGRGRQGVFVLRGDEAWRTLLDIGVSDGQRVEIIAGAQPGDRLIVSDLSRFKDLDRLRLTP